MIRAKFLLDLRGGGADAGDTVVLARSAGVRLGGAARG
jgi:hypothetical protein